MSNVTFKAGDLVYFPAINTKVNKLSSTSCHCYSLAVGSDDTFTKDGMLRNSDKQQTIFHATEENREWLSKLYGVEFEAPPKKLTGSDLTRKLLADGAKYVLCYVSGHDANPSSKDYIRVVNCVDEDGFCAINGCQWRYATPIKVLDNIDVMEGV